MPPIYAPPACPLHSATVDKLQALTRDRQHNTYKTQIKEALKGLADAIYDAQSRLRDRNATLKHIQTQRRQGNKEKSEREEKLEQHVAELEEEVQNLTEQAEELVRSCIDQQFAIEDEAQVVSELSAAAREARNARGGADENDEAPPAPSMVNQVQELRDQKASAWESQSNFQRYAKNNDYINFKRLWHDGAVGDDGSVLPNAEKWFRSDGTPVMEIRRAGGDGDDDDELDDDIAVARENISLTCPLSMLPLKEPYTNKNCNHTFEKQSIIEYLRGTRGQLQCPTTGCSQVSLVSRWMFVVCV